MSARLQGNASCCLNGRLTVFQELLEPDSDRVYQRDSLHCSCQQREPDVFLAPCARFLLGIRLLPSEVLLLSPGQTNGIVIARV